MEVDSTPATVPPFDIAAAAMIFQEEHLTPKKIAVEVFDFLADLV